jgi:filamentous hemagglutinin family protein
MSGRKVNQSELAHARSEWNPLRLSPLCRALALMLASGAGVSAHAATNLANIGAQMSAARNAAGAAGVRNLGVSSQQALQASQPSIQNLAHAAQGIAQQIAAQQAAAAAGIGAASNVPNGLGVGGLQVAPGISADQSNPALWINTSLPTQSIDGNGHVHVEVKQTAQNAVVTWQTMNVGRQTTLNFDQSGGTQNNGANNWVVLNRIMDPSGAPSQILGNVTAQGSVYVINRNGILFGAGSQVNVHSLLASTLDLLNTTDFQTGTGVVSGNLVQGAADIVASNKLFLGIQGGLAGLESSATLNAGGDSNPNEVLGLGNQVQVNSVSQYQAPGDITIAPGASISTQANGTVSDGGFVLIAASNVNNGGSITATAGQVVLAAGVGVSLSPNPGQPQVLLPELSGRLVTGSGGAQTDVTPAGTLTNTGIVQAARGNINLMGSQVVQKGVVGVTTSVNTPGAITISTVDEYQANAPGTAQTQFPGQVSLVTTDQSGGAADAHRAGLLTFGPGSVTTVLPDTDGQTATSAPGTIFTPGNITITAGSAWFQGGSLIEAPGSTVSVAALTPTSGLGVAPAGDTAVPGRIYLDTGATIDVSGLADVELPISSILVTVPRIGQNELADSPLLRNGFLFGLKNVVFDSTLTGTNADGLQWVGSPILNLAGYVSLMPRTVDQLLVNGGTILLSGKQVMTAAGSTLNLNGGYVHYAGGTVDTTRLVDANGLIVPIGQASPFDTYVGIAGQFTENHPRWGVTKTWFDPLLDGGTVESDFIVGGNAGTLDVFASQAMVLDGDITAQALGGSKQVQGDSQPVGGTFNLGTDPAASATLSRLGNLPGLTQGATTSTSGENGVVIVQNSAPQLSDIAPGFSIDTSLDATAMSALSSTDPNNVLATTVVPASTLSAGGFAKLNIGEDKTGGLGLIVADGTQLKLQAGGSITLSGGGLTSTTVIDGALIIPSGTVSISNGSDITVGPNGRIDVAGQWVNNSQSNNAQGNDASTGDTQTDGTPGNNTQSPAEAISGDSEFINGGAVTLSAGGGIDLHSGSVIDVSSGGELQANGQLLMSNGIPEGKGGSLSLLTYTNQAGFPDLPTDSHLKMDGTIRSFGFAGGGTFTLQVTGIQIGGDPESAPVWTTTLPTDFFAQQGFGSYVLNALFDATVAPGAIVDVTQQNFIPNVPALQQAASGADLSTAGLTTLGALDPYHRQATDFVLTAGGYLAWQRPDQFGVQQPVRVYPGVTGGVSVGEGAAIIGDAGASIGIGSPLQVTVLGSLIAPGGSITLSSDSLVGGPFEQSGQYQSGGSNGFTSPGKSVWLGSDALLDVAGVALSNPLAAPVRSGVSTVTPDTGKVLPGGSVTISDDSGYVVAQAGSRIDVSGASANFDQLQSGGGYASQPVWSDAGSITLGASSGLLFDGSLKAQPGGALAQGGTLSLLPEAYAELGTQVGLPNTNLPGATLLVIQQNGTLVPAGLAAGQSIADVVGASTGVLQFAADRLAGSGITTLELGNPNTSNSGRLGVTPLAFSGDVDLTLGRAVIVDAGQVAALSGAQVASLMPGVDAGTGQWLPPAQSSLASLLSSEPVTATGTATDTSVTINAPYVAFVGPTLAVGVKATELSAVKTLADGTLSVNAAFIDLENQVQLNNFAQTDFTSSGDIRLSSASASQIVGGALEPGEFFTSGNLSFKAVDLYPSTGTPFILDAVGVNDPATGQPVSTTITFLSNGASTVPLSAGGTLLVDASEIAQDGTVRAPSGSLIFGVGDPTDAATKTQFNNLPLVATSAVSLGNGSVTSVSNEGTVIPYGTTVDGVEWQFNPVAGSAQPDSSAPPSKFISVNGSSVALNAGASIDLSGGGDLQAMEWVAGTGGSRDVLSQYNVSFASTPSGVAIPVNIGATNVYAIVPGAQSPVAAYDPVLAQTLQPSVNANGSVATITRGSGVGQASLTDEVGQAVYLSGVPGLPAGVYTLLPGKYATLPGAYRVTVSSTGGALMPGASQMLPDGTVVTAGYFADTLGNSRAATPTLFNVQSGAVWQQYSQYTLTDANAFFPKLAASAGHVTPPLPVDGGQLVLAATNALTLGATLNTAAGVGGAPAEVDIASQDIQITGNGAMDGSALPGYLQISAAALDSLNAGSLLIGGTRTATANGITIDPIANSVIVSNDSGSALTGPEILLVTKTDTTVVDPNAVNGLLIDAGSVITASGNYPGAKDVPITIGQLANSTTSAPAISGDGAFLRVSNGADALVTRLDATGTGLLTVSAGATLTGGQSLTLDSSGNLKVDPSATLSARSITADGASITFTNATGAAAASLPGFVVGDATLAQFSNAQQVTLRSAGAISFVGDIDVSFGNSVDLSAGSFTSDGGAVTLNAQQIAFTNETGAPTPAGTSGAGTLTVNAKEIDLGTGEKTVSGFGTVTMNATSGIVGQGTGTFDFGALPVSLNAPVYLADTGSASTVKTTGVLNLNSIAGTAPALTPVGGEWNFTGGTVNDNGALIEAPAGNVSLDATSGDLTIGSGATVSSAGASKQFFDVTAYAPAGAITLTADAGTVDVQSGSTLDFSGANGGGAAGSLTLSALQQVVNLNGTIKGEAAAGFAGGSFSLNTGGAADLDSLAGTLASSGVTEAITIQTKQGNLTLSEGNTLTAHAVSLTADGGAGGGDPANGQIMIAGSIDASGIQGGEIDLYGNGGVDIEGKLLAIATIDGVNLNPNQRGGTINIGTGALFDPANGYNATYGYENMLNSGAIRIGAGARLDVSGGTAGGLSGGTINFRAPLLSDNTVNVSIAPVFGPDAGLFGSRSTTLEAYAVWSTTDTTTGAQHFDGIVDPAGWYGDSVAGAGQPAMMAGVWTDQSGNVLAAPATDQQLKDYQTNDYFTPTTANADHQDFYGYVLNSDGSVSGPGTLMGFVEGFPISASTTAGFANVANFHVVPGIELDNPTPATGSTSINDGNISILTNWNLGAGSSPTDLAFRFNGQAPDITFRAENNVKVDASLSDGFFQIANPLGGGGGIPVPSLSKYGYFQAAGDLYNAAAGSYSGAGTSGSGIAYYAANGFVPGLVDLTSADPQELQEYYALFAAYGQFLDLTLPAQLAQKFGLQANLSYLQQIYSDRNGTIFSGQPSAPVAPPVPVSQAGLNNYAALYLEYISQYPAYIAAVYSNALKTDLNPVPRMVPPVAPAAVLDIVPVATSTIPTPAVTDNTPSSLATAANPFPLQSASLAGGASSSYRVVAGADFESANPLSVQAMSLFKASGTGSVTLDDHTAYVDSNGRMLVAPTMIRTGTGSIDIAAGGDVALLDTTVPGVIYTAGAPAAGAPAVGSAATIISGSASQGDPDILVTASVNPDSAGDISIHAQGDINGVGNVVDTTGAVSGFAGQNIGQYWWQWMEIGNPTGLVGATNPKTQTIQTSIDFGAFDQGVMSVGGNVSVTAGGSISDLAVSLPTTWYLTEANTDTPVVNTVGGGNLTVKAGADIRSGAYFVAKGTGSIVAGGQVGTDGLDYTTYSPSNASVGLNPIISLGQVATVFAVQDAVMNVSARQGANIGGVLDPSDEPIAPGYHQLADAQPYSSTSAIDVESVTGNINFGTLTPTLVAANNALPASLNLTAFTGGINLDSGSTLFPSAVGQLNLIADQSIAFSDVANGSSGFGMSDADPSSMPSPTQPLATPDLHASSALHADDTDPVRIYSLNGSIVDGVLEPAGVDHAGFYDKLVTLSVDKPALIQAGQDIVNLSFQGQNLRTADITRIVAGRDIYDTPLPTGAVPSMVLGGPGTFDVEAGRNIGPLTPANQGVVGLTSVPTGIDAVGNANNPNLPHESASIQVLFGIGPGVDDAGFISTYIDPASVVAGVPSSTPALIAFMEQYDAGQGVDTGLVADKTAAEQASTLKNGGPLTASSAWAQFQALPGYVQQLFAEQVLFHVLTAVGQDFNNPASPFFAQYARGYQAINTLFPASLGYTANSLGGGANGASQLIDTGDLDIRSTTIQTQQGGNVTLLGPGGQALIGSTSAPPESVNSQGQVIAGPGSMGILTLEQGDIDIFTDQSLLLAQSRVFTEQGGNMTIWSSNGDINAGKGSKSVTDTPAPNYVCDANHYCTLDARGEVSGAGIGILQTIPNAPTGDANLIAPRGTVDAGDAGIRVSGNLNVAALHVANVDNIQVQGKSTGIPVVTAVNTGALTAASSAASAASQMAQDIVKRNASGVQQRHWIITVQVEGFGDSSADLDNPKRKKHGTVPISYNPSSEVSVLGLGGAGPTQRSYLSKEEQKELGGM